MTKPLFAIATTTVLTLLSIHAKVKAFDFATDASGNPLSNGTQVQNQWTGWDISSADKNQKPENPNATPLVYNASQTQALAKSVEFKFDNQTKHEFKFSPDAVQQIKWQYGVNGAIADSQWQTYSQDVPQLPEPSVGLALIALGLLGSRQLVKMQETES